MSDTNFLDNNNYNASVGGESFHSHAEEESSSSFQSMGTSSPFFADAMLDLDTAHDLAETPDASQFQRRTIAPSELHMQQHAKELQLPSTNNSTHSSNNSNNAVPETPRRRLKSNSGLDHNEDGGAQQQQQLSAGINTSSALSDDNTPEKHEMVRITNQDSLSQRGVQSLRRMRLLWASLPKTRPTWPRDWVWALAFCIVVPLSFAGPLGLAKPRQEIWTEPPLSTATFWAWWGSAGAAALTTRWMYGRKWTDEDRSSRHERVAAGLVSFAAWSVVVYLVLAVTIFIRLPKARWATALPLAYTVRDVYLVRRWKTRRGVIMHASTQAASPNSSSSASSHASRYAFFQALTAMALDILAKSLRRASFFRVLSLILLTQTLVIGLWRQALIGALDDESVWLLLLAALGGKWATGYLARLLSLIASGGVVNWFVQQQEQYPDDDNGSEDDFGDVEMSGAADSPVPEAYRTVGASVYQSVLRVDDVFEDDDDDDFDDEQFQQEVQQESGRPAQVNPESLSTVRGMLLAGLSVSFGSVAMCGLLGGPAQFVWSQIRKVNIWQQGHEPTESILEKTWNRVLLWARSFVRSHSDLAMSHVAAYYKPYPRAARDVARLIEEAGVEPVLHDDITTHMCSCVGGSISGVIVLLTGHFAQRQRNVGEYPATDLDVVKNLLLAFILSYTLLFTVMEPLRAAIKAVYVAFAQNPRSLSHAYPLVYHRLSRLSEANLN